MSFTNRFKPLQLPSGRYLPFQIYGTAWKTGETAVLTHAALKKGFGGIDTANYPVAYDEAGAGDAIVMAMQDGLTRDQIFVETKFTPSWPQEAHKIPYNTNQPIEAQIRQSVAQSFSHLQVDEIDLLVLHIPFQQDQDTLEAWRTFESYVPNQCHALGVSNIDLATLKKLYDSASIKPVLVQNRFHLESGYDIELRKYCEQNGIIYQAFGMLQHNKEITESELLSKMAAGMKVEKELAFYASILSLGNITILNGTTDESHMDGDVQFISRLVSDSKWSNQYAAMFDEFRELISDLAVREVSKM